MRRIVGYKEIILRHIVRDHRGRPIMVVRTAKRHLSATKGWGSVFGIRTFRVPAPIKMLAEREEIFHRYRMPPRPPTIAVPRHLNTRRIQPMPLPLTERQLMRHAWYRRQKQKGAAK